MQWTEQAEPDRIESLETLCQRSGLLRTLEISLQAQNNPINIWFKQSVRNEVLKYLSSFRVEAGGLLLGSRFSPTDFGEILSIEYFVPGTEFEGTGVSLSMGTSVWDAARPYLDQGSIVVGWVHSHPNLGAFFSGTDRRTQRHFFAKTWQVGLCIDPIRNEEAWFYGPDSEEFGIKVMC